MANEFSVEGKESAFELTDENTSIQNKKDKMVSEDELRFVKQQKINLKIKEAMAQELQDMELPDQMVNEILNLEDDVPF